MVRLQDIRKTVFAYLIAGSEVEDYSRVFAFITPGTTMFSTTTGTGWKMQLRAIASHPSIVQFYKTYTETNTYSIQVRQNFTQDV